MGGGEELSRVTSLIGDAPDMLVVLTAWDFFKSRIFTELTSHCFLESGLARSQMHRDSWSV